MYLNDNPVCSTIKYFENSVTFFCGVGGGGGGGGGGGRGGGGGGPGWSRRRGVWLWEACVLRSNSYPVILRDKVPLSYNPFAKLT